MAQGTLDLNESGLYGSRLRGKVEWRTQGDAATNTSAITATVYIRKFNPDELLTVPTTGTFAYSLNIGNTAVADRVYLSVLLDWVEVATYTVPAFPHRDDGTCDVTLSASVTGPGLTSLAGHVTEGSAVISPDPIPRAAQPTCSMQEADLGQSVRILTNRPDSSFTCDLTYSFAGQEGVIARGVAHEAVWTPPLDLARHIPGSDAARAVVCCHTYRGSTLIGTSTCDLTLRVPDTVVPTLTVTWLDATTAFETFGTLVQNASALELDITAAGAYASVIESRTVTLNGGPYAGQTIRTAGEHLLEVAVTDSRGRTARYSQTLSVAAYELPALELTAHRCGPDGTADDQGEYAQITLKGGITPLPGNTPALTLTWGTQSHTFTPEELWKSENISTIIDNFQAQRTVDAPSTATMALTARLEDALYAVTRQMTLSTGYATLDFLAGGRGVSMGKTATRAGFDCAMPAYFTAGVNGVYLQTAAGESLRLQPEGNSSILLFGGGAQPVWGMVLLAAGQASWSGTEGVTVQTLQDGAVELTLPAGTAALTAISAAPFAFI